MYQGKEDLIYATVKWTLHVSRLGGLDVYHSKMDIACVKVKWT